VSRASRGPFPAVSLETSRGTPDFSKRAHRVPRVPRSWCLMFPKRQTAFGLNKTTKTCQQDARHAVDGRCSSVCPQNVRVALQLLAEVKEILHCRSLLSRQDNATADVSARSTAMQRHAWPLLSGAFIVPSGRTNAAPHAPRSF